MTAGSGPGSLYLRHLRTVTGGQTANGIAHRARLLEAIGRACVQKGYANVTIADVVALAGVSRRTFYQHFPGKEDCLLDAYATGAAALQNAIAAAVRAADPGDWRDRVRVGLTAFTETLAEEPVLANILYVQVHGAGPRGVPVRRQVHERWAALFGPVSGSGRKSDEQMRTVPASYRHALVGAHVELVSRHLETHDAQSLQELAPTLIDVAITTLEAGRRSGARRARPASGARRGRGTKQYGRGTE